MTSLAQGVAPTDVDRVLSCLFDPALAALTTRLAGVPGLASGERQAVAHGVARVLRDVVWQRVRRVVLVELHAARIAGRLTAADSRARWAEWVDTLSRPGGWRAAAAPYPDLLPRLRAVIAHRCEAGHRFAVRFARDRSRLASLLGQAPGSLTEVRFGAGDSHHEGQTVAALRLTGGRLVYKPRPVAVDAALAGFLRQVLADVPAAEQIRVPAVVPGNDPEGSYGWAAHIAHRYCQSNRELTTFYRGIGQWLAVMRLLGGSDLHAENVIASGPVPVVVDCETLFTPYRTATARGYGDAVALAVERLGQSLLQIGLLPGRGSLGGQGADLSAAGALPGQQPLRTVPMIADPGTDQARVKLARAELRHPGANLPSPEPDLRRHWEDVVAGYDALSGRLRALDAAGALEPTLARFAEVTVRVVVRDTSLYSGLIEMLWHPSALFEPEPARRRAAELLARQARNRHGVPDDPAVIDAELAELLVGDVPVFTTTGGSGVLRGPGGTRWGPPQDLVASALRRWRHSDLVADRQVIRATLVCAYLNEAAPGQVRGSAPPVRTDRLDHRRRTQAALIMRQLVANAVRGRDGTATWVAPVFSPRHGWSVRATTLDVYNGLAGIAILLAGYQREAACGRADPVPDLAGTLAAVVRTIELAEDQQLVERAEAAADGVAARPEPPGAYLGLAARIWTWLLLPTLGAISTDQGQRRAVAAAEQLAVALAADEADDLLTGSAGAIVPLLRLADATGQTRWRQLARAIGQRLADHAISADPGVHWPGDGPTIPPTIGVSHGAYGIGWALTRLAAATGDASSAQLAESAYAWADSFYRDGWRDPRDVDHPPIDTWCHGAPGIGLCAADLLAGGAGPLPAPAVARWRQTLARAAEVVWPDRLDRSLTVCHGDPGRWELLDRAWRLGLAPAGLDLDAVVAQIVGTIEADGPGTGVSRDVFQPGLLAGSGGVAYQLLRMHSECDLPSVLLPDPAPLRRPAPPARV